MAKAGFAYTPSNSPEDDTATCFYCNLSLSGWDADDDPTYAHLSIHIIPQLINILYFTTVKNIINVKKSPAHLVISSKAKTS